jgi:hypothetical protein
LPKFKLPWRRVLPELPTRGPYYKSQSFVIEIAILYLLEKSGVDWIDLAQDRDQWKVLVNTVMILRVSKKAGTFLSSCTMGGFSRRAQLHEVGCAFLMQCYNSCPAMITPMKQTNKKGGI